MGELPSGPAERICNLPPPATWRVAPGEEIVEGIIREIFQKGYKSAKSAQ
jgi:hypothetical protein